MGNSTAVPPGAEEEKPLKREKKARPPKPRPDAQYVPVETWLEEHPGLIGRSKLYSLIAEGVCPHLRLGRKILLPRNLLNILLERQSSGTR